MASLSLPARSALLALMTIGDLVPNSRIRDVFGFVIKKPEREELLEHGYVKLKQGPRNSYLHELTEAGWVACREELRAAAPSRADRGYRVLYPVVNLLERHLTATRATLADVVLADSEPPEPEPEPDVDAEIRSAYRLLVERPGGWVRLGRLREELGLPREVVDKALLRFDRMRTARLIAEVNRKSLSDVDRMAAIRIGNQDKHLLSIDQA
jgi:hypothetical protein